MDSAKLAQTKAIARTCKAICLFGNLGLASTDKKLSLFVFAYLVHSRFLAVTLPVILD